MARDLRRIRLAQSLRKKVVPAEALLWEALRNRALAGFKFRRQHPIGPYVWISRTSNASSWLSWMVLAICRARMPTRNAPGFWKPQDGM